MGNISMLEYGRKILAAIEEASSDEAYAEIEARTDYPDRDKFGSDEECDEAVDRAELKALKDLIEEELK